MPVEITMPQLSDTMTEGTVVRWLKKEGEKVKAGEIIAEIETDKANMEMEAFDGGTLAVVSAKEGDKVAVGGIIAVLATAKEDAGTIKTQYAKKGGGAKSAAAPVAAAKPAAGGAAVAPAGKGRDQLSIESEDDVRREPAAAATAPRPTAGGAGDRVHASPLARRLAREKGIELAGISGSGPGGRITEQDVLSAAVKTQAPVGRAPAAAAGAAANGAPMPVRVGSGKKQVIPLAKMRQVIAQRLQASKQNIPHYYETIDADVEEITRLRGLINEQLKAENVRLSVGDFVVKAVTCALLAHPGVNATFNGTEVTRYGDVHLGMAVALPDGLIVPVLRNVQQMGLREIRQRSADLVERARGQKLKQDELSGATFTVSNLGSYGVREFSAIINPPEVAILAVGAAAKRAVVRGEQIVARTMLSVTLSADHRVIDGAMAAEFLRTLKSLLEEPAAMLVM